MNKTTVAMAFAATTILGACGSVGEKKGVQVPVFSQNDMDLSVPAADNFYLYANGGWMKNNPLPDDKSRFGSFDKLAEENREKVKSIIEKAAAENAPAGSISQKIGDFFASGMDTVAIEDTGLTPLQPYLVQIDAIQNTNELIAALGRLQRMQLAQVYYFFAEGDAKNSQMVIANIYQGGLGMPDRDYYFDKGQHSEDIRNAYTKYLTTLWEYMGDDEASAKAKADQVVKFETRLAAVSNTREENRDPIKTYNKLDNKALETLTPGFDWNEMFVAMKINRPNHINVYQPKFMAEVAKMVKEEPLEIWKVYLKTNLIRSTATYLPKNFVDANFEFYGKTLSGQPSQEPRWKRVLNTTSGALGEAVGQLFVKEYFPPQAKVRMEQLVENLRTSFAQRINQLDWMSDSTKQQALGKLAAIRVKIGYPNKWRDYSSLEISRDSYLTNVLRSNEFDFAFETAKIDKPVDPESWLMTPQTVNAYYHPTNNEIVFPAAILQPPFFYLDGDDAVNYGAIGVVIGHEMTHGFDDQGRQYDKNGNLSDWWTVEDAAKFAAKTNVLVEQFNQFTVLDSVKANGSLTLGENIADLGGLTISYQAFRNTIKEEPAPIDGFTADQRFYLGYARIWAQNIRDAEKLRRQKTDEHSLGEHRVMGPIVHLETFYNAFDIDEKSPIYRQPTDRAVIW
ncbi:MAG: M13 family metallopeptidase [Breznakibacter sp.]